MQGSFITTPYIQEYHSNISMVPKICTNSFSRQNSNISAKNLLFQPSNALSFLYQTRRAESLQLDGTLDEEWVAWRGIQAQFVDLRGRRPFQPDLGCLGEAGAAVGIDLCTNPKRHVQHPHGVYRCIINTPSVGGQDHHLMSALAPDISLSCWSSCESSAPACGLYDLAVA